MFLETSDFSYLFILNKTQGNNLGDCHAEVVSTGNDLVVLFLLTAVNTCVT